MQTCRLMIGLCTPISKGNLIDRLGQGVVVAVTLGSHGGLNAGFGQPLAVANR